MKIEGIQSIFFVVSDLPRSVAYYRDLLQMEPTQRGNLATFQFGETQFLMHAESENLRVPSGTKRGQGVALHFKVSDIDAHFERLKKMGIPIAEEPKDQPYGMREFAMRDPDGYEIEFVQPIKVAR